MPTLPRSQRPSRRWRSRLAERVVPYYKRGVRMFHRFNRATAFGLVLSVALALAGCRRIRNWRHRSSVAVARPTRALPPVRPNSVGVHMVCRSPPRPVADDTRHVVGRALHVGGHGAQRTVIEYDSGASDEDVTDLDAASLEKVRALALSALGRPPVPYETTRDDAEWCQLDMISDRAMRQFRAPISSQQPTIAHLFRELAPRLPRFPP